MPDSGGPDGLQRQFEALQAAHPELEPLAVLVLLAVRQSDSPNGVTTARLSRRLGIEHALIRRAAAELEALGWIVTEPVGGASPALRLISARERAPSDAQSPNA
ncbi:MarR family transcriptional regulator [Salinicola peritrichatus]|uniref:MarR family transcriptional regulator n=1 Tax=Salinicola peritrichatus TaxID=1267424 RepID=UPI0013A66D14|nr:helix-turn-helix domain-containing protein [Salinicola peritrichatus]